MRDEKDPGTIEMRLPGRRGRKPVKGHAMSSAERSRRYRQRRGERQNMAIEAPGNASNAALLEELKSSMAAGAGDAVHRVLRELGKRFPKTAKAHDPR